VERLWISSLTPQAIRAGFGALRPARDFDPLAAAADGRARADWLVGMNLTRLYTVRFGPELSSVGRVQTPTLAMLVERERAIQRFVPEHYCEVVATFGAGADAYLGTWFDPSKAKQGEGGDHGIMKRSDFVAFIRGHKLAVQASVSELGAPQAAVVGVVVTDEFEVFFDTLVISRKCQNLRRDPRISFVIGWDAETVQLEGVADEPEGEELARLQRRYFDSFPDGLERQVLPDITYFRARCTWVRYSDFREKEARIKEYAAAELLI
jgi:general stress protein 26